MEQETTQIQRALVVDDDVSIRLMLARVLEREHFTVETARDGVEALDQLAKDHFDVIFLDLMMPRIDGLGVLRYLRAHSPESLKTIVVMTAFHNIEPEVYQQEPWKVVQKPFDLNEVIESAVEIVAAERQGAEALDDAQSVDQ